MCTWVASSNPDPPLFLMRFATDSSRAFFASKVVALPFCEELCLAVMAALEKAIGFKEAPPRKDD